MSLLWRLEWQDLETALGWDVGEWNMCEYIKALLSPHCPAEHLLLALEPRIAPVARCLPACAPRCQRVGYCCTYDIYKVVQIRTSTLLVFLFACFFLVIIFACVHPVYYPVYF